MDNKIQYLNTDLDLTCPLELTALAEAFARQGVYSLHVTRCDDGRWIATFETDDQHAEPQTSIDALISVVESLEPHLKSIWLACTRREFNIGYDCGAEPWEFNQGLSAELLGRIAAIGASIRITLYPDRPTESAIRHETDTDE